MTPDPGLLDALLWWCAAVDAGDGRQFALHLRDEIEKVKNARALYPSAHAIGDRVRVVYPMVPGGDFTGEVVSLHIFADRTIVHVRSTERPVIAVDAVFVHGAT